MCAQTRLLIVTAHPDDESFPIGGAIARYASQGVHVTLLCATRGEKGIPGVAAAETARIREQELRNAAALLGVAEVRFLDLIDGEVGQTPVDALAERVLTVMRQVRPDAVITFGPDGVSGHPDHVAMSHATTQAFDRAVAGQMLAPTARLFYITPSEATLQGCGVPPMPQLAGGPVAAIDVGAFLTTKVRASQQHVSQHPPFTGAPEEEAKKLVCHEYFTLVRGGPALSPSTFDDLFSIL